MAIIKLNLNGSGKTVTIIPDDKAQDVEILTFEFVEKSPNQFSHDIVFPDYMVTVQWLVGVDEPTKTRIAHT